MSKDAMPEYQLLAYRPEHRDGILQLLGNEPHKRLLWQWQFAAASQTDNALVVAVVGDEVVGFNGAMPIRVHYQQQEHPALWSCDFNVAERFRGQGLGKAIKQELHRRCDHIMSLGISDLATPVLEKSGWCKGSTVYSLRYYRGWAADRRLLLRPWQWLLAWRNRLSPAKQILTTDWQWQLPEDAILDRLWASMREHSGPLVVRDSRYLRWRYGEHPLGHYRYLTASHHGAVVALAVVRCQGDQAVLVDYVGPCQQLEAKAALFYLWLQLAQECTHFNLHTSDQEFVAIASSHGFRTVGEQRFYIHDRHMRYQHWFIMAGDSDGELLAAARQSVLGEDSDGGVVAALSDGWFAAAAPEWQRLLAASDADPLFMSWPWLLSWWRTWGRPLGLELALLGHFDRELRLDALAPMQLCTIGGCFPRQRQVLQLLGGAWGKAPTVRTEYGSWLANSDVALQRFAALWQGLERLRFTEWALCDVRQGSQFHHFIGSLYNRWPQRCFNSEPAYTITTRCFADFVAGLGDNSRFNLLNRRRQLFSGGAAVLRALVPADFPDFLAQLNTFHRQRWGKDCFERLACDFHCQLQQRLPPGALDISTITVDGQEVSLLYNIRMGGAAYNIQQGYDERQSRKYSLGTIHLGLAIEQYCSDAQVARFRLLAGRGKRANYKERLAFIEDQLIGIQLFRSRYWYWRYRLRDLLVRLRDQGRRLLSPISGG